MPRHTPAPYVPLDVNYPRDPKIRKAGPEAELLFIRSLAYSKAARTDGFIPEFDLVVVSVGLRNVSKSVARLVDIGLWLKGTEGWQIRAWQRWNPPVVDEDQYAEHQSDKGKLGNHERWHVARGVTEPECPHCTDANRVPDRSSDRNSDASRDRTPESPIKEGKGKELKPAIAAAPREDVETLCQQLLTGIIGNGSRAKVTAAWRDDARKLLDLDERPLPEALALADWCQRDQFWKGNVLSMASFRKQYDKLRLKAGSALRHATGTLTDEECDAEIGQYYFTPVEREHYANDDERRAHLKAQVVAERERRRAEVRARHARKSA